MILNPDLSCDSRDLVILERLASSALTSGRLVPNTLLGG